MPLAYSVSIGASDIFLGLLILLVFAIAMTAVFHLFLLDVPYVPTPRRVVDAMIKAARLKKEEVVYDLGAGDGRLVIAAKKAQHSIQAIGCEIVPTVWLLGWLRILFSGQRVIWKMRNALTQNLRNADVIFLYVTPKLMKKLQAKFDRELKRGTRVVSYVFRFPDRKPVREVRVPWLKGTKLLRVYQW